MGLASEDQLYICHTMPMPHGPFPSRFEAVLFDVDGTLVDSIEMIIRGLGDTFEEYYQVRPEDHEIRALIGMPLTIQYGAFAAKPPTEDQVADMSRFTLRRYAHHQGSQKWFDEAVETVRVCHQSGLKTALVTSKNSEELAAFLPIFPSTAFVDTTVCASDVRQPKPHPESAFLACSRLNVDPSRAVLVGDSIFDMRCARGAGLSCIAVAYGAGSRESLLAEHPDDLFDTPRELLNWAKTAFLQKSCAETR